MNDAEIYLHGYRTINPGFAFGKNISCPEYDDWRDYINECDKKINCIGVLLDHEKDEHCLKSEIIDIVNNKNAELLLKMSPTQLASRINIVKPGYKKVFIDKRHEGDNIMCYADFSLDEVIKECNNNDYCKGIELIPSTTDENKYSMCLKSEVLPYTNKTGWKIFVKDGVSITTAPATATATAATNTTATNATGDANNKEINGINGMSWIIIIFVFIAIVIIAIVVIKSGTKNKNS